MKAIRFFLVAIFLLLIGTGCATTYRKNLETFSQERETLFFQKTMDWVSSATREISATPPQSETAAISPISSASDTPDRALRVAAQFFTVTPEQLESRWNILSQKDRMRQILSKKIHWPDLAVSVAIHNPTVLSAKERWQATLMQYNQASFLDGLISTYRTFTRYLNVDTGKPFHQQMTQSFFPYPSTYALKGAMIREDARMAELDWQQMLRDMVIEAGMAFYDYQYLIRAEASAQENIDLLGNLLNVIEDRYRSGAASQPDIIRVQTELEQQRNILKDYQSQQRIQIAKIIALLGEKEIHPLGTPSQENETVVIGNPAEWIQRAHENRQEVLIQQAKISSMEIAIRMGEIMNRPPASQGYSQLERGMMPESNLPGLEGRTSPIGQSGSPSQEVMGSNSGMGETAMPYGLQTKTVTRPDYAQSESYLAEMRKRLASERYALDQTMADTTALATSVWEDLDIAQRRVSLIDKIELPQNQSMYETMLRNYQSGSASFGELLDVEKELIATRLELQDAYRMLNQTILRKVTVTGQYPLPL